jgi:hypothetical protein
MNVRHFGKWCMVAALAALGTSFGPQRVIAAQPGPADAEQGVQVLTRGPVHEAFAETVTFDPEPGIVVPKAPPAAIEELPPDQKPEGDHVAWIPGYWGWDDERSDFLWVSGVWRALPPGRQWMPGYWGQSAQGYQWTSGYWADAKVSQVAYLAEPPATVEAGPNVAAPSPDSLWLPGCWVWQNDRYAWRPGSWAGAQPDWDWVPAHYVYAPRGYVFVDGYWDYSVGRRGVLFAPVYFDAGVYAQPGFSYSPATVIDLGMLANHLFLRPQYQHYYFGDYYAANYQAAGFYPSYSYNSGRYGYDPIYAHERWQHRQDGQWEHRVAADFQNRRDHEEARPPRTWAAQQALGTGDARARERGLVVASPFSQVTKNPNSPQRFQPIDQSERQKLGQHGQDVQRFRDERQKQEARVAAPATGQPAKQVAPAPVTLPRSPIAARPVADLGKDHVPPPRHEPPKPDLKVEGKPRVVRTPEQPQQHTVNRLPLDTKQPPANAPPHADQPHPQPAPHVDQPHPQPAQHADQPHPQPQAQPQHPQPQAQPQHPQPQAQPQHPQPQPQPKGQAGPPPAGPKEDEHKDKGKGK